MDLRVLDNHPLTYLHLLISLRVRDLTFIAIFIYTDENVNTIVPWIGTEHVYFFFLLISLDTCKGEVELTKRQVSERWDVDGWDLSKTRNVYHLAQVKLIPIHSQQAVVRDDNRNEL